MTHVKHLIRDIWSDTISRLMIILFGVCLIALLAIGITYLVRGTDDMNSGLDAAGLEQSEVSAIESEANRVNTSQLPDTSFIYEISIAELANADSYLNEQLVQVTGEVVGDRIIAEGDPNFCWVVLQSTEKNDSELSVYMPVSMSDAIDTYGAYGKRGTTLQVRGTFYLADKDHQGSSELRAESVSVVEKGIVENQPFSLRRMLPGVFLLLVGSALMVLFMVLRERRR